MDGRGLRYFVEVVRQGGFTRAAEALNVTQSAVSKMVRQLEDHLGAPLLIRGSQGIRLTDAGHLAYERGVKILEGICTLKADMDALQGLTRGSLRLGLPPMVGGSFFPLVLRAFRQRYPDVILTVVECGGRRIRDLILSGDVDVGVTLLPFDDGQFDGLAFADHELALVVPRTGKWTRCHGVDLADLADEPFVMLTEDFLTVERFREACLASGFVPKEAGRSGQWDFLAAMVEAGMGVSVLPTSMGKALRSYRVKLVPLRPAIRRRLALIWRRDGCPPAAVHAWAAITRDVLMPV
jgi:DNA-binding transcriptional LysR family regulator